jgi:hypothetical protein
MLVTDTGCGFQALQNIFFENEGYSNAVVFVYQYLQVRGLWFMKNIS